MLHPSLLQPYDFHDPIHLDSPTVDIRGQLISTYLNESINTVVLFDYDLKMKESDGDIGQYIMKTDEIAKFSRDIAFRISGFSYFDMSSLLRTWKLNSSVELNLFTSKLE